MILKLFLPTVDRVTQQARFVRWCVDLGDEVGYGDDLCELEISEIQTLERTVAADRLISWASRRRSSREPSTRSTTVSYRIAVTSSDRGTFREPAVTPGDLVRPGDLLAVLSTDPHEPLSDESRSSTFRAVSSLVDSGAG